jgi:hypothetical protein
MAIESVASVGSIEREEGTDISISGLFSVISRRNYSDSPSFNYLGKLTDIELRTVVNQASNVQAAVISGLRTVGDLVSSSDPKTGDFNPLGVGWLVKHLADTLDAVIEIDASACMELADRGYNSIGRPVPRAAERTGEA